MDRRYFELEEDMQEPQKTTFEKKRDMIEERFTILKNDMHTLRMSVQQTTNEVKGVYQHVMKLQNVVDNVSENVKIQLHESKIFRERKVMEYRQLLEKSKRVLDESKSLVQAFEHVKQNRIVEQMKGCGWMMSSLDVLDISITALKISTPMVIANFAKMGFSHGNVVR
ncbi:hypothetical protein ACH3XW_48520 [Acanthocheilonema viteae]